MSIPMSKEEGIMTKTKIEWADAVWNEVPQFSSYMYSNGNRMLGGTE